VTGGAIKFIGVGEKYDALEPFHPIASSRAFSGWATSCR
jgi:signal recognition particle GTPase